MSRKRKRRKAGAPGVVKQTWTDKNGQTREATLRHIHKDVDPPTSPKSQNMVSTAHWVIPSHLNNMSNLAITLGGKFQPRIFPTCTVKMKRPRVTISIFRTGSIVIAGARKACEAVLALNLLQHRVFLATRHMPTIFNQQLQNVVGSAYLGFRVDLDKLMADRPLACKYSPSLFAGLCYRVEVDRQIILVIFESGSVVITGCRTSDEVTLVFWEHVEMFQQYVMK